MQLARLVARDQISEEEARRILSHETEHYVSELESQAHLLFRPENPIENFLEQLDALIGRQP